MTITATALIAFATFLIGLYLGHRWGGHDAQVESNAQKRRLHRLLRFAQPYIDAHAEAQHWTIYRDKDDAIIDLHEPPTRCGTSALLLKEMLTERDRRKTLH